MIHHPSPPTRGDTMKFIRRHDLDPQTRIEIVKLAWSHQGIYGKMTELAQTYQISRTFLYQLTWAAQHQLEDLFSDSQQVVVPPESLFEPLMLLARLEGNCSIPSLSSILKRLEYRPNSIGYLSETFHAYGACVPSTLSMPQTQLVFYLSDELFALQSPILITLEAQSTAILKIQLASDRCAPTWQAHFEDLRDHQFQSIGMASDRGVGLVAGYQAACQDAIWVCDQFHEFQDLFKRCHQLERQAYRAIAHEQERAETFHNAKSEANLQNRLEQYERAQHACEQAMAKYDQLDVLLHLLREALHFCTAFGRLRTVAEVRSELTLILNWIEEIEDTKLPQILKPIRSHLDDLLVPFQQVESIHSELLDLMPESVVDALVLAWHHDHLSHQAHGRKQHYHQRENQQWLDFAQGLLEDQFDLFKSVVFEKLDSIVKASSLVEMVNSLIRPFLHTCRGQITQETLNLIMFYHNHRRYKGGKRKGKAPIELLTGETLEDDWVDLLIQHKREAEQNASGASTPPLELVPGSQGPTPPIQTPDEPLSLEDGADSAPRLPFVEAEAA
jgi:hypothetical protein